MKMGRCSVKNCPSSFDNDGIKPTGVEFYQFPSPEESLRVLHWKLACNDKEIMEKDPSELNKLNLICSKHFDKYFRIGLKLKMDAVPTLKLFLPPDNALESQIEPLDDVSTETKIFSNAQTQTTMDLTLGIPKVNKLKKLVLAKKKLIQHMNRHVLALERTRDNCVLCSQRRGPAGRSLQIDESDMEFDD